MSDRTIRVVARVIALPDRIEQLKTVLSQLVTPTRAETGCLQYDLFQNQQDPTDFTFIEEWETETALSNHLQSEHIQIAYQQVEGLVAAEPDIRRYTKII